MQGLCEQHRLIETDVKHGPMTKRGQNKNMFTEQT